MKTLYLDIETLPAPESSHDTLQLLYRKKLEKNAKKKEISEEIIVEEKPEGFDDYVRSTSFDGAFGRILCIGYAIDDQPTDIICNPDDERKTLEQFWKIAGDVSLFVGHNIMEFDLRFIYQRSVVLGVKPTRMDLSFAKYRSSPIFDTMQEWSKWAYSKDKSGLEHLALAMGIPTPKEGIDGSQVYDFYKAGKVKEICDYCKRDVETTRAVYKRMVFAI